MSSSTTDYPICTEWLCERYFTTSQIISDILMIGRLVAAIIILLLGFKIEKDFMRSVTTVLFIPITIGELFTIYCEVASYLKLFQQTKLLSQKFYQMHIFWTTKFAYVIYNYIHYNVMVLLIILLNCCRLATKKDNVVNAFPVHTICLTVQIIPLFLCILSYVSDKNHEVVLQVLSIISRIVNIICFIVISIQIFISFVLLCRELPLEHASSVDMQIRDARSRLAWTLIYLIIPYLMLIPYFVNAVVWLTDMGAEQNAVDKILELFISIVNYFRPTWMVVITVAFLPPYRRAVVLMFCCCACCPNVEIEKLPRKPKEMSLMYKYADI